MVQVAGGSGLTPMLQVAYEVLKDPDDKTDVTLIFANVSDNDIILKDLLDELEEKHSNFHVHYVVSRNVRAALLSSASHPSCKSARHQAVTEGPLRHAQVENKEGKAFTGSVGRVNEQILTEHLPAPGPDSLVLVCGPPGMMVSPDAHQLPATLFTHQLRGA